MKREPKGNKILFFGHAKNLVIILLNVLKEKQSLSLESRTSPNDPRVSFFKQSLHYVIASQILSSWGNQVSTIFQCYGIHIRSQNLELGFVQNSKKGIQNVHQFERSFGEFESYVGKIGWIGYLEIGHLKNQVQCIGLGD